MKILKWLKSLFVCTVSVETYLKELRAKYEKYPEQEFIDNYGNTQQ